MIRSRGHSPIGLHYDQRSFRVVQLSRRHGRWALAAAARVQRTGRGQCPDIGELKSLQTVLNRQGFVGSRVVLAVPTSQMLMGVVEVPPRSSGAPIGEIARSELARIHGCNPVSIESTCWELPRVLGGQTATQALTLGCPHAVADPLLDAFDEAGLDIAALDSEVSAAIRICGRRFAGDGLAGIIDFGWNDTQLSLLLGGQILYHRTIVDAGIGPIATQLAETLGVDDTIVDRLVTASTADGAGGNVHDAVRDALEAHWRLIVEETAAPLSYVAHQYVDADVQELFLTGYTSLDDRAAEFFAAKLNRPVRAVRPSDLTTCLPDLADKAADSSLTTAVGLAEFFTEAAA